MLAALWFGFFAAGFAATLFQWLVRDRSEVFSELIQTIFEMASLGVEISFGLVGILCVWLGLFQIAERAGLIRLLSKALSPLFLRLMPEVPPGHPAIGSVTMNLAANMLGLDNAATPMGLKAMRDLQDLNPRQNTASNAQILFLVLNTSSVTLIPVTVLLFRAQQGSSDPSAVFVPILLATSASTLTGLVAVGMVQRLKLLDPVVIAYVLGFSVCLTGFVTYLGHLPSQILAARSSLLGNLLLFSVIMTFLGVGVVRRINVYEAFIDGAKQGFEVAVNLIPYLVAMLVAIGTLRASGALEALLEGIRWTLDGLGLNTDFVAALPTAFMKPLSGSGSRAMLLETMEAYGVDSFPATVAAIVQGSTETTFYVLAVYFGSVGIRRVRHALPCGLIADLAGVTAAILIGYWFFY